MPIYTHTKNFSGTEFLREITEQADSFWIHFGFPSLDLKNVDVTVLTPAFPCLTWEDSVVSEQEDLFSTVCQFLQAGYFHAEMWKEMLLFLYQIVLLVF